MKKHDTFLCSPHVEGCDCPSIEDWLCNPYFVAGYCPTEGAGETCAADSSKLKIRQIGDGFTWAMDRTSLP